MLSKVASSTIFWVFGMTLHGIEPWSPGPLVNTLLIRPKCVYIWVQICIYIYIYMGICIYRYSCVCMCGCMYLCTCVYVYLYIYIYMCVCVCMWVHIYIYVCVCLYIYVYIYIYFSNLSDQAGCDSRSVFKQSLTGLNSDLSFSKTGGHTKCHEPVCPSINS